MNFILGRIHGAKRWNIVVGPEESKAVHANVWNSRLGNNNVDPIYAEIIRCDAGGQNRKRFSATNAAHFESSSSNSSSSSSTFASFSSSSSSSSTAASFSSSSSSSSSHSRSSSSSNSSSSSSSSSSSP